MSMKFASPEVQPVRGMEWIIAVISTIQALYIFSPIYDYSVAANGLSAFAAALSHPALVYAWASVLLVTALMIIYGIKKDKPRMRSAGLFGQCFARFYNVTTTILVAGLLPINWIYPFTIVLICVMLWITERLNIRNAAS